MLRMEAGAVSYAELAGRIARRRLAGGASESAARVARSTIFDAFRTGRSRINAALVYEIVLALGREPAEAERWRRRCVDALAKAPGAAGTSPVVVPDSTPGSRAMPDSEVTASASAPTARSFASGNQVNAEHLRGALIVMVMIAATGLNLFGGSVMATFKMPLFLDMIGTAVTAFALGPWHGAIVGVATNAFGAFLGAPETIMFGLVNATGAILWGYGIRRYARTVPRFLALSVAVALVCSVVGVPLNVLMYGGAYPGHATEAFLSTWSESGVLVAASLANGSVSVVDKLIASVLALMLARLLAPLRLSGEAEMPKLLRR